MKMFTVNTRVYVFEPGLPLPLSPVAFDREKQAFFEWFARAIAKHFTKMFTVDTRVYRKTLGPAWAQKMFTVNTRVYGKHACLRF